MKINLTKKQYEDIVMMSRLANSILGILGDNVDNKYYKEMSDRIGKIEDYIVNFAKYFECEDLVENFKGKIIISDKADEKFQKIINDYDNEIFWYELEIRMGKRDFERTMTKEEKRYIKENNGWLQERINELYDKYADEFEKYGIERLEIKENKTED